MDRLDRRILHELQQDGRISNAELAERVGLTPSPCLRRVRHLEERGVVRGFQPFVTVVMRHEDRATVSEFERRVAELPEVVEAHRLFGDPDYLLRVAVADLAAYERFVTDVLSGLPGIAQVHSHLTMKQVKADTGIPLG